MIPDNNPLNEGNNILIVDKQLAKLIGLNESIALRQLDHWLRSRFSREMEDKHWIYNTYKQWQEDKNFPFWSISTIRRVFDSLEKRELIITTSKFNKVKYDKTKWYSINYDKVIEILPTQEATAQNEQRGTINDKATAQNEQTDVFKMSRPTVQNEQTDVLKMNTPIPKTTTNKTTKITTDTTTTTPTHHPLSSSLPNSQSQEIVDDSNAQPIANAILDLFSADRARKLIQEYGYDTIYRACCYVATANRDKPKDKHLTPRFVFAELSGAGNIPANYEPPVDYSEFYANADSKSEQVVDVIATEEVIDVPQPIQPKPALVEGAESTKLDPSDMSDEQKAWQATLSQFKLQHEKQYVYYLAKSKFLRVEHGVYVIEVPDARCRDYLQKRLYRALLNLLDWRFDAPVSIRFCIPAEVVTIEPQQSDSEPQKPKKPTVIEVEIKHIRKSFVVPKTRVSDEKPVSAEQMMAGRMLFNQLVNKRKMESDVTQGKIVDLTGAGGQGKVIIESDVSMG